MTQGFVRMEGTKFIAILTKYFASDVFMKVFGSAGDRVYDCLR